MLAPDFTGVQFVLSRDLGLPLVLDPQVNSGTTAATGTPRLRESTYWWLLGQRLPQVVW